MRIALRILGYVITFTAAFLILDSAVAQDLLSRIVPITFVAEFVAGMFYTSLITTPISIALLTTLSTTSNIYFVALIGGVGAVVGDFLILNVFSKIGSTITIRNRKPRFHTKIPKSLLRTLGVLCLILPVPDEVAMALLGISRISTRMFILVVYPAKALGIFMVTLGVSSLWF